MIARRASSTNNSAHRVIAICTIIGAFRTHIGAHVGIQDSIAALIRDNTICYPWFIVKRRVSTYLFFNTKSMS